MGELTQPMDEAPQPLDETTQLMDEIDQHMGIEHLLNKPTELTPTDVSHLFSHIGLISDPVTRRVFVNQLFQKLSTFTD